MAQQVHDELQVLDQSRRTLFEQRLFLADLFHTAYDVVRMGLDGNYDNSFFVSVNVMHR